MVIKSEKKSKKKFEMKPKCIVRSRNPNARTRGCPFQHHLGHMGAHWLPIPKDRYPEFLADVAAAKKIRAEGKNLDPNMFAKYFQGKGNGCMPKRLPKWKQVSLLKELKEKEAARVKANALKRKNKRAYRLKKEMEQHLLEQEQLVASSNNTNSTC